MFMPLTKSDKESPQTTRAHHPKTRMETVRNRFHKKVKSPEKIISETRRNFKYVFWPDRFIRYFFVFICLGLFIFLSVLVFTCGCVSGFCRFNWL